MYVRLRETAQRPTKHRPATTRTPRHTRHTVHGVMRMPACTPNACTGAPPLCMLGTMQAAHRLAFHGSRRPSTLHVEPLCTPPPCNEDPPCTTTSTLSARQPPLCTRTHCALNRRSTGRSARHSICSAHETLPCIPPHSAPQPDLHDDSSARRSAHWSEK